MTRSFAAHYDGKSIIPDGPVELPVGRPLRVRIELSDGVPGPYADLVRFAVDLPDAPSDLSSQHDHYLYGLPKR